jgi:hypothetical protein
LLNDRLCARLVQDFQCVEKKSGLVARPDAFLYSAYAFDGKGALVFSFAPPLQGAYVLDALIGCAGDDIVWIQHFSPPGWPLT